MWIEVGPIEDVTKRKRVVVEHDGEEILVYTHAGVVHAMANRCIHRDRELVKGVVLRDKLVCPGHQWAFDIGTGWESVKQECQPVFTVEVHEGIVRVDPTSRRIVTSPSD